MTTEKRVTIFAEHVPNTNAIPLMKISNYRHQEFSVKRSDESEFQISENISYTFWLKQLYLSQMFLPNKYHLPLSLQKEL